MKKLLVALCSGLLATAVWAGPEVDMDNDNTCHFPLAHWDPNQELNLDTGDCESGVSEVHGRAVGYCFCKKERVPEPLLEFIHWSDQRITPDGLIRILKVSSGQVPRYFGPCTLDVDGDPDYQSYDWEARIVYNEEKEKARALLICRDGQPVGK